MTIEAVVFDIGNVLIRWAPEAFYDRAIGQDRRLRLFQEVDLTGMNEGVDLGADFRQSVSDLADAHPDWATEIRMWEEHWLEMASPAIDRSVRLLRALRRTKIPVYALSNFGRETFRIAEGNYPFLEEFDIRILSGEHKMMKPDPAIYHLLEEQSGVAPEALFFTDDRPENIDTAKERGWQTHLFEGAKGLAERLVEEGLLTEEAAE
ncbi:MAG: haloacid dehalogenase [Rhodobacterales bacterium]|nr:MAG: haloacid dehalogenase [Rhodobacterales bacterium]